MAQEQLAYRGFNFNVLQFEERGIYGCVFEGETIFEHCDIKNCYEHMLKWDKIELEDYLNLLKVTNENK